MIKRDEILDKNSCLNRAKEDEFVFVLLGRDKATADTIRYWVKKRIELGKNQMGDEQIQKALNEAYELDGGLAP